MTANPTKVLQKLPKSWQWRKKIEALKEIFKMQFLKFIATYGNEKMRFFRMNIKKSFRECNRMSMSYLFWWEEEREKIPSCRMWQKMENVYNVMRNQNLFLQAIFPIWLYPKKKTTSFLQQCDIKMRTKMLSLLVAFLCSSRSYSIFFFLSILAWELQFSWINIPSCPTT